MAFRPAKAGLRDGQITLSKFRYESTTSIEQALLKRRSGSRNRYRESLLWSPVG